MRIFIVFLLFIYSCNNSYVVNYELIINSNDKILNKKSTIEISVNGLNADEIIAIKYYLNGTQIQSTAKLTNTKLGLNKIDLIISTKNKIYNLNKEFDVFSDFEPEIYTYTIINEFNHDISSYTQGLEFYNEYLYESTGLNGFSSLRKIDLFNNKVLETRFLDKQYFGEGLTIINDKILQLTWKSKLGFIYDLKSFNMIGSFEYGKSFEGWGLANDGKTIYKSDGTDKIWLLDGEKFNELGYIEVITNNKKIKNINELEIVGDVIYANTYQFNNDVGLIINKNTGAVNGIINFKGLRDKVKKHPDLDVLNGIAFNKKRNSFFVTGKKWNKIFEIKISKQ